MFTKSVVSFAVLALANASALSQRSSSGKGTFYGGNLSGGTCMFTTYTLPAGLFGTAFSGAIWDSAANCGACVKVTGPAGNSITAMVVDQCPECASGSLDLFPTAFSALSDPSVGIIPITWDFVECGITTPLQVVSKSGVSAYWFSMQVVNANKRVTSLEVSTNGGSTWQATTRKDYNFFENQSGFGTTTVDVKITSIDGETVVIKGVTVGSGVSATASSNFGSSSGSAVEAVAKVETTSSAEAAAVVDTPATTAEAPAATETAAGAVFMEASSSVAEIPTSAVVKSTLYRTTSILRTTTLSSTTTSTSTVTYYPSTSNTTVTVKATKYVEAALPTNTYPISVITISTCVPTVIYSVVTIVPTASPKSSSVANATIPIATLTPTASSSTPTFTGSAASLHGSGSMILAAAAGLAAVLFA